MNTPDPAHPSKQITLTSVRTGNLSSIDIALPHNQLTILTGPSGSGKTTLAIHTLCAESQRRLTSSAFTLGRKFPLNTIRMQPEFDSISGLLPTLNINAAVENFPKRARMYDFLGVAPFLSRIFYDYAIPACRHCGQDMAFTSTKSLAKTLVSEIANDTMKHSYGIGVIIPIRLPESKALKSKAASAKRRKYERAQALKKSLVFHINSLRHCGYRRYLIQNQLFKFPLLSHGDDDAANSQVARQFETIVELFHTGELMPTIIVLTESVAIPAPADFASDSDQLDSEARLHAALENALKVLLPSFDVPSSKADISHPRLIALVDLSFIEKTASQGSTSTSFANTPHRWYTSSGFYCSNCLLTAKKLLPQPYTENCCHVCKGSGEIRRKKETSDCTQCLGTGLSAEVLQHKLLNKNLAQFISANAQELSHFLEMLEVHHPQLQSTSDSSTTNITNIRTLLEALDLLRLAHLPLMRILGTLSSGELWRVVIARALVSELRETLFVLDEISRYLHPDDMSHIYRCLAMVRNRGNTVLITESNYDFFREADFIIELGLNQGKGIVCYQGEVQAWTRKFPRDALVHKPATNRRSLPLEFITIGNTKIPKNAIVAITGVSGSGKTSLMRNLAATLSAKQSHRVPVICVLPQWHHTALKHSNPALNRKMSTKMHSAHSASVAALLDIDTLLAQAFAAMPLARRLGLSVNDFSLRHPGGRCEACLGTGFHKIELDFVGIEFEPCDTCLSKRFSLRPQKVSLSGSTIADVYDCSILETLALFSREEMLVQIFEFINLFQLGHLILGQSVTTLSWSSFSRLRLARSLLHLRGRQAWLFIDQPLTGLSGDEVFLCLKRLREATKTGLSFVFSTHDRTAIQASDYVVEL